MSAPETEPDSDQPEPVTGKMTERFAIDGDPVDALKTLLADLPD